ncbi:MAG: hypothetical protein ACOC2V_02075 [Alkalispirochaeta sp.]
MAFFLEDSDGGMQDNPSEAQIAAILERIGTSLDHCVLHLEGDYFVQTAGDTSGLLLQYSDSSGFYESPATDFDVATVARIFADSAAGRDGWKQKYVFHRTDGPGGAEESVSPETSRGSSFRMPGTGTGSANEAGAGTLAGAGGGSFKDQLLNQVKREIGREASRGVGNLIRKGIRGISRR